MNRFIIVDGLPYLYANNSAFAVRWDEAGFTVGDAADVPVIPYPVYSEREVKAKCAVLDSIGAIHENQKGQDSNDLDKTADHDDQDGHEDQEGQDSTEGTAFDDMTLAELKDYAKEHNISLNGARTKAAIIEAINAGQVVNPDADES